MRRALGIHRIFLWMLTAALCAVTVHGFLAERLFDQAIWTPLGGQRLALFTLWYVLVVIGVFAWRARWFVPIVLAFAGFYTVVAAGVAAPLAVLYILFSAYLAGRLLLGRSAGEILDHLLALAAGLVVILFVIGLAVHVRINFWPVYLVLFATPWLVGRREVIPAIRRCLRLAGPTELPDLPAYLGLAAVFFPLTAHWLVALKPEASSDGLSMHLTAPAFVAMHGLWTFDFRTFAWGLIPMGGDWLYTAAYLLAGEQASRLMNFAVLALLTAMLFAAARRRLAVAPASLVAALFAATSLVQLVTGSLFVENVWAMLLFAALAAVWRYHETGAVRFFYLTALLLGGAVAVKMQAGACALPLGLVALVELFRRSRAPKRNAIGPALLWLAIAVVLFAPPYLNAWLKTGNPIFPFLNNVFRSPYFDSSVAFQDPRFHSGLSWRTLYDVTFHSGRYMEGQPGSLGFHYLLLVPLVLGVLNRRLGFDGWTALGSSLVFTAVIFAVQPNVRYVYPALPMLMVAIAAVLASLGEEDRALYGTVCAVAAVAFALDMYFLAASGWNQKSFFLNAFDRGDRQRYILSDAPSRGIVDYLNRTQPGAPVAFLDDDSVAGLQGKPYSTTWHCPEFGHRVLYASSPEEILKIAGEYHVDWFVAPATTGTIPLFPHIRAFVERCTTPVYAFGRLQVSRRKDHCDPAPPPSRPAPAPPGSYDDLDLRIEYTGSWVHDRQFSEPFSGTVSYSAWAGDSFRFTFRGSRITWFYTAAANRGIAAVSIDGVARGLVDQYSPGTHWRRSVSYRVLGGGVHTLLVRVLARKNHASSGAFVDVDQLVVE